MPGGSPAAWPLVKGVLQSIAAKLDDGTPCCQWIGPGGAGHFVKWYTMVSSMEICS